MTIPAHPTFAAGDLVVIDLPVQRWNASTKTWDTEVTTDGSWDACVVSKDGATRHTAVVSCSASSAGVVQLTLTALQTAAIPPGVQAISLRRLDGGPLTYLPTPVTVLRARPA